ncbi:MAG: TIGR02285 family protein [Methylococcaceae bacterium]|nr:TIGR02285 family protein [Methylococcaceae bacterium]
MPRFFRRYALLAWIGIVASWMPSFADAKETVTWAVLHFPPFQILEGPHQGSGSFDGELQVLMEKMPEFDHRIVSMSFARRKEEFMSGSNICTPGMFKAPAQAMKLAVSVPMLTHLDNRVVYRKDHESLIGTANPVDLDDLFARRDLIGAVMPGRSYAPNIDQAIERHRGNPNLFSRALETSQLFHMLLDGDLHYLLLFSHEAAYLARDLGADDRIANRPIAGTPPYIFTHVACTGNAWGQALIERINAVMATERREAGYRALSERWYPAEDQQRVRRFYPEMLQILP